MVGDKAQMHFSDQTLCYVGCAQSIVQVHTSTPVCRHLYGCMMAHEGVQ